MGLTQSVSASEVAQRTQVSIEEAEELLAAFNKHTGTQTIGLDAFKQVLSATQHLYDSPAFSPEAADLYFQIFDTKHDGLSTCHAYDAPTPAAA
jgi:Ca2+-binding EF-hand superfamily protein